MFPLPGSSPRGRLLAGAFLLLTAACAHPDYGSSPGGGSAGGGAGGGGNDPCDANPAPSLEILEPGADLEVRIGEPLFVTAVADDEEEALLDLFLDADGDLSTTGDQVHVAGPVPDENGQEMLFQVDTSTLEPGLVQVLGRLADSCQEVVAAAPGRVLLTENASPTLEILSPATDTCARPGDLVGVTFRADDPDDEALVDLFLDLDGDPGTTGDQIAWGGPFVEADGAEVSVELDTTGVPEGTWFILGRIEDSLNAAAWAVAPGRLSLAATGCPPAITLLEPAEDFTLKLGETLPVLWAADDPDSVAAVDLFADADGDPGTTEDQHLLQGGLLEQDGATVETLVDFQAAGLGEGLWTILGRVDDGENPPAWDAAPGRVETVEDLPGSITLLEPAADLALEAGSLLSLRWVAEDPDEEALASFFLDADGDPGTTEDQWFLAGPVPEQDGIEMALDADTSGIPEGSWFVLGLLESTLETVHDLAPGKVCLWSGSPPPGLDLLEPAEDTTLLLGQPLTVTWVAEDPGGTAEVGLWLDADGELATEDDRLSLGGPWASGAGAEVSVEIDTTGLEAGTWSLLGTISDGSLCGPMHDFADGRITLEEDTSGDGCALALGGFYADGAGGVAALPDGGAYVTGSFEGSATFGAFTLTSAGRSDIFLLRLDENCQVLWAVSAGGDGDDHGLDVCVTSDGGAAITGSFDDDAVFGAGEPNETTLEHDHKDDLFVARYGPDGLLQWAFGATGKHDDVGAAIAEMPVGCVAVTGSFRGPLEFPGGLSLDAPVQDDALLFVVLPDGAVLWAQQAGGSPGLSYGTDIVALDDSSLAVTGAFSQDATFGEGTSAVTLTSDTGTLDVFLARWTMHGDLLWATRAGGSAGDEGSAVTVLADGSLAAGGLFQVNAVFGEGEANETTLSSVSGDDAFVARYAEDGSLLWARSGGGPGWDAVRSLSALADGGLAMTGVFDAAFSWEGLTLQANQQDDSFLARLDADGLPLWLVRTAGRGPKDGAMDLATLASGRLAALGVFTGQAVFGEGLSSLTLDSHGAEDVWFAVYPEDGNF